MQSDTLVNYPNSTVSKSKAQQQSTLDQTYRYWRMRIFYSMFVGYTLFYFTRKSYNFVMPVMMDDLGFTKAELGMIGTALYLTYGVSKFISGIMSEYVNPRYFMAIGLIITGVLNICFGFSSSLLMFVILCALNGWFQGFGWPPCTKLLTHWYSRSERGTWWSVCSLSHGIGGMLIPVFSGYIAMLFGWRWGMHWPGILAIFVGFWLLNRLRDVPQTLGLPPIEEYRNDYSDNENGKSTIVNDKLTVKEVLFNHVLNNGKVWFLAITYFFVYVVRTGINDWAHIYLIEVKGYELLFANASIFWFEIGGLAGMLVAGFGSDYLFKGRRLPIIIAFSFGLFIAIPCFYFSPQGSYWLDYILMTVIGFLVYGPQMLVGLAVAEYVVKQAACTANGFAGLFGYLGSAVAAYPIGCILDYWGWQGYFITISICTVIVLLMSIHAGKQAKRGDKSAEGLGTAKA